MNVMVIGGSGLFGRKTVIHLLQDPEISNVVSMDVTPPKDWFMKSIEKYTKKFHFVRGDVSELEDILAAMKSFSIEKVVNWAFVLGADVDSHPRLATKVNALGMCNVFEAARIMGVSRVIYASSETVYGGQADYGDRAVTEDDRLYPGNDAYALCKLLAEVLAEQYTRIYGMSFTGVRPTVGYGHGGQSVFIVKWFSDVISLPAIGKPISFEVDGKGLCSLVAADDLGEFTRILLHASSSRHPVYNVGGPPCSLRDLAHQVRRYLPDARIDFGDKPMLVPEGRQWLPWKVSSARAREDFGFSTMPLEEAVLIHINDARLEAGLPPIKGPKRK